MSDNRSQTERFAWFKNSLTVVAGVAAILSSIAAGVSSCAAIKQNQLVKTQQEEFKKIRQQDKYALIRSEFLGILQDISKTYGNAIEKQIQYDESDLIGTMNASIGNAHAMLVLRAINLMPELEAKNEVSADEYLILAEAAYQQGWDERAEKWALKGTESTDHRLKASAFRILGDVAYSRQKLHEGYKFYKKAEQAITDAPNIIHSEQQALLVQTHIFWYQSELMFGKTERAHELLGETEELAHKLKQGQYKESALKAVQQFKVEEAP